MNIHHPAAYLSRAEKHRIIDEARHEQTRQRRFENSFVNYDAFTQLDDDDSEHCRVVYAEAGLLASVGRKDITLNSPARRAQLDLDFEYFEEKLKRIDTSLFLVFRAVFYGFSWQDLGMPKRTWWNRIEKIEKILTQDT